MSFDTTWADVIVLAPDLATLTEAQQDMILGFVDGEISETKASTRYVQMCLNLAAHIGTVVKRGINGPGGVISSESVGPVSRAYAVFSPMGSDALLDTTPFGKEYRRLVRNSVERFGFVI